MFDCRFKNKKLKIFYCQLLIIYCHSSFFSTALPFSIFNFQFSINEL
jgi:hypothetical protein